MSKCELCDEKGYDLWKCSICNKTPLCAKHVILQRDSYGMWVMYCYGCVKLKTKKLKSSEKRRMKEDELIKEFACNCAYISDRASYDRLFRTHWLFLNAFPTEMKKEKIKWDELNLIEGN